MAPNLHTTNPRAQALVLLTRVLDDACTLDEALAKAPLVGSAEDQRFAMSLALTTLEHLGQIDALIALCLTKPLPKKRSRLMHALRLGVAQLRFMEVAAHAAVNETVQLVKQGKEKALAGLVNAVLQRIAREQTPLPSITHNVPAWLRERWEAAYGAEVIAQIATLAATRAPLDLHTPASMAVGTRLDPYILRLQQPHSPVEELPGYAEGAFFVQDIAASYPVRMLGEVRGLTVLDACAAPGGKTLQLLQAGAQVTALDRAPTRMERMQQNLERMKREAVCVIADALTWQPPEMYDVVLLDAPCTATGTWRKHPEVVHLVTHESIAEMAALQRELLARAWGWVKPGGRLLYCVCSLEREEGEAQAAWFAAAQDDATLICSNAANTGIPPECFTREGYLRTLPSHRADHGGMDGFFAAVWRKMCS